MIRSVLKSQYHASLAMLRDAIEHCPTEEWVSTRHKNACWQVAYHTLFFAHLYLQRDEAAFNTLVRLHQAAVYRLLLRLLRNAAEAEDVAQDVFITVFKAIDGFRGESKLSTWIHRIATNHARNRLKYYGRKRRGRDRPAPRLPLSPRRR